MKFMPKKCGKFSIPLKDGAVLHFDTVRDDRVVAHLLKNKIEIVGFSMLITKEKLSLVGWDGIEDQEGAAIPFSDEIRDAIYTEEIIYDNDLREKIRIAMAGPSGN